jgi:hypothetical protein
MFAAGTTIQNNTIRHTPWTGIAIGWGWGVYTTPTVVRDNRLVSNRISHFLEQLWDGGAVYVNGSQGTGMQNGLLLQLNVADHKRPSAGGNVFYTDGGSRYVTLEWPGPGSASLLRRFGDHEFTRWMIAVLDSLDSLCAVTALKVSYGAEMGGCVPRGHLTFVDNYFAEPIRFFDFCTSNLDVPVAIPDVSISNRAIQTEADVPSWIIEQAGKR